MESVEKVTGGIPESMPQQTTPMGVLGEAEDGVNEGVQSGGRSAGTSVITETKPVGAASHQELIKDLLSAGRSLLDQLSRAFEASNDNGGNGNAPTEQAFGKIMIRRDEKSGRSYVQLPLPGPEMIQKAAGLLGAFVGRLQ